MTIFEAYGPRRTTKFGLAGLAGLAGPGGGRIARMDTGNVLVDGDDHAKVTDFGLAKGTAEVRLSNTSRCETPDTYQWGIDGKLTIGRATPGQT